MENTLFLPKPVRAKDLVCEQIPWLDDAAGSFTKWAQENPEKMVVGIHLHQPKYAGWYHGAGIVWCLHPEAAQASVTGQGGNEEWS
jgi:hypothetical protein